MSRIDNALEELRRWEAFGALWEVVRRTESELTVSLCRCDGGEEVGRITSGDPAFLAHVSDGSPR